MIQLRCIRALTVSMLFFCAPLSAAVDRWTPAGPDGGTVLSLASAAGVPGLVYAGTDSAGVFASRDGGTTWEPARSGLPSGDPIRLLAAGGRDGRFLYAATRLSFYASADGGGHWARRALPVEIPDGLFEAGIVALVASPAAPQTVYLSYDLAPTGGLLKSTDGGRTWRALDPGVTPDFPPSFSAVAVAPSAPETVYLVAPLGELLRSTDGGNHWSAPGRLASSGAAKLAVDPRNPRTIVAAYADRVSRSTDGGATWSQMAAVEPAPQGEIRVAADLAIEPGPASPSTIHFAFNRLVSGDGTWYGGGLVKYEGRIFRSTNGGASWSRRAVTDPVAALEVDGVRPSRLYAGVSRLGVLRSTDRGTAWSKSNRGLTAATGCAVTPDPFTRDLLYLSAGACAGGFDILETNGDPGFFKGILGTGSGRWTPVNQGVRVLTRVLEAYGVVADPLVAGTLYALTGNGLYNSFNGGGRWESLQSGLGSILEAVLAVAVDPTDSQTLYAVGYKLGYPICGGFCPLLPVYDAAKSTDGGVTWQRLALGTLSLGFESEDITRFDIAVDPIDPKILYLANARGRLIKSTDRGASWAELTVRPASLPDAKGFVSRLVIDPSSSADSRTLYAVAYFSAENLQTVLKSTDGGHSWVPASPGLPQFVRDLALDPSRPATLYAATSQGVYVSEDAAGHWSLLSKGLTNRDVLHIRLDPFDPATLYAATQGDGGLFVLTRSGR